MEYALRIWNEIDVVDRFEEMHMFAQDGPVLIQAYCLPEQRVVMITERESHRLRAATGAEPMEDVDRDA
jgi:negative regulator of genetic competence, sporulation and motility